MAIFLQPQRTVLPLDASGRELLEYPHPAFPCFMEVADLNRYVEVPWHWHEVVELCIVREGAIDFHAGGEIRRLHSGMGCFVNRSVLHAVQVVPGAPALTAAIQFSPELFTGGAASALYRQLAVPVLDRPGLSCLWLDPAAAWQGALLDHIRAILGFPDTAGQELLITAHLAEIWHLLLNHAMPRRPPPRADLQAAQRVKAMMRLIHARYAEPLTLAQIAAAASVSPRECTRCFRRVTGDSPVAYLIAFRVSMAAALLESTDESVTEIGLRTGFGNPSYFTRAFARQMGMTPRDFRAARRRSGGQAL